MYVVGIRGNFFNVFSDVYRGFETFEMCEVQMMVSWIVGYFMARPVGRGLMVFFVLWGIGNVYSGVFLLLCYYF